MGMYRVVLKHNQDGETVQVVTGWITAGSTSQSDGTFLAGQVNAAWKARILPQCVDDLLYEGLTWYSPQNLNVGGVIADSATGSIDSSPPLPTFVCARVNVATGLRGRSFQGRFGIPGMSINAADPNNGNQIENTKRASLEANINLVNSDVTQGNFAVISEYSNGAKRPEPIVTPATTVSVGAYFGSRVSRRT